jgi:hypothetical protein
LFGSYSYLLIQGRLHWGQYITPSFTADQYKAKDPDFYASIASFKAVAESFDPGRMMGNNFLNQVIWEWLAVPILRRVMYDINGP